MNLECFVFLFPKLFKGINIFLILLNYKLLKDMIVGGTMNKYIYKRKKVSKLWFITLHDLNSTKKNKFSPLFQRIK